LIIAFLLISVLLTPLAVPVSAQSSVSEVRISITRDQWGLTPYDYNTGYPGYIMMSLLYDNLLWYGPDGNLIPWLASGYSVSEDGLTWIFTLRENATWHDGEPVTAQDVTFTLEFVKNNQHLRWTSAVTTQVQSAEVIDDHTVAIHLNAPSLSFAQLIAADLPILPEHIWKDAQVTWGEPVHVPPIGSGPYKLVEHQADVMYRMEANPDYWGGKPLVDRLIFVVVTDINAQMTALRSGAVDFATGYVPPELVDDMNDGKNIAIARTPGYVVDYVGMHCDRAPLNDTAFRQALAYAVDVQEITDTPKKGEEKTLKIADWAQVRWTKSPVLIHPLTGAQFDLGRHGGLSDTELQDIKQRSFAHFSRLVDALGAQGDTPQDWRKLLLAFWRFGPELAEEEDHGKLGALWPLCRRIRACPITRSGIT
jgi:ABC-type transport system substrate-binding protein